MTTMTAAESAHAIRAFDLVSQLQRRFADALVAADRGGAFTPVTWLRNGGQHGGGNRLEAPEGGGFDRGSINVSQVHYPDLPERRLASATALSTIIHPRHPRVPSVHIHLSLTELRDATASWRLMADLNPAIPDDDDRDRFALALRQAAPKLYDAARAQGDRYFHIPALGRTRGSTHFYLEQHTTGDAHADLELARRVGTTAVDTYVEVLGRASSRPVRDGDHALQLAYHTLYLFQVLTLDRGTTSGLMVHDQNDLGIMGSLPSQVDGRLLKSWAGLVPDPQGELVHALVAILGETTPAAVNTARKLALAQAVRAHYRNHPAALALQAAGDVVPPTVQNHR